MFSRTLRVLSIAVTVAACGDGYGNESDDDYDLGEERNNANGDAGAGKDAGKDASAAKDGGGGGQNYADAGTGDSGTGGKDAGADASTGGGGDAGAAACADLTYAKFGRQFLSTYCVSCHGNSAPRAGLSLDTLAGLQARKAGVKTQVLNGNMPQGNNKPSAADRMRLGQWIDCGAL